MSSPENESATGRWDEEIHAAGDLYRDASRQWGTEAQMARAAEEFSELAAICARDLNDQADLQDLLNELVDARVMIEQLAEHITDEALEETADEKLDQLDARLFGGGRDAE